MRRAVVVDGNFAVYENGSVFQIVDGVEIPIKLNTSTQYFTFSYKKNYAVHRLVAESFIPNPDRKPIVNHIDGNKLNNDVSNLEWVTAGENRRHAVRTGLTPHMYSISRGRISKTTKFSRMGHMRIKAGLRQKDVAEAIGVSLVTISYWERGLSKPSLSNRYMLANLYGCDVEDIIVRKEA